MYPKFMIIACLLIALISAAPVSMDKRGKVTDMVKACFGCAGGGAPKKPPPVEVSKPPLGVSAKDQRPPLGVTAPAKKDSFSSATSSFSNIASFKSTTSPPPSPKKQ